MIVFDAGRRRPGVRLGQGFLSCHMRRLSRGRRCVGVRSPTCSSTRAALAGRRLVVVVSVALASCGPQGSERAEGARSDTVTQAQRDSAVARSGLPGARGVTRAQDVSSAAEQRAAQLDSIR